MTAPTPPLRPRTAIYLRTSTDHQETANQVPGVERLCFGRGWVGTKPEGIHDVACVYREVESGAKVRPILDELCERARQGEFQTIVVWAIDRIGRDFYDIVDRVRSLDRAGVRLVSHQESWLDTGSIGREALLGLMAWVAQEERKRLSARIKAGLERRRKEGGRLGRPPKDVPSETVQRILEMRSQGRSWRTIAQHVRVNQSRCRRIVRSVSESGVELAGLTPPVSKSARPVLSENPPRASLGSEVGGPGGTANLQVSTSREESAEDTGR